MRPPALRLHLDGLIVDSFAGGGGASLGIEMATGRSPDVAINHDAEAIAMHAVNHPSTKHYVQDVWAVDPRKACKGQKVALAWFSPDCFPAGTMILARDGYRPIEEIETGDEVLTHRLRWRKVTNTMRAVKPLVRLRGQGHPGLLVSPEHPFYARHRKDVWNNDPPRGYDRRLGPAAWTRAGDLDRGWYWASPTEFPPADVPPIPVYRTRETTITDSLLWLAGLYVADGWTRLTETRAELVITCGRHEVEKLRQALSVWPRSGTRSGSDELSFHERETGTAYQFTANHRGLVEWLREHFGHGAAEKRIPGWALGMKGSMRRALLAGYLSGDGCISEGDGNPLTIATTVSKALAFGVKALASSLGFSPAVSLRLDQPDVIQGRKVNVRPAWAVKWRESPDPAHRQTFSDGDGLLWAAVREREDNVAEAAEVFNLSVEEDESYVADGILVHNCTFHSKARGGKPFRERNPARRRRGLAWVVVRWAKAVKPRVIILENVEEFQDWGPLTEEGQPDPTKRGFTFRRWLAQLRGCGYVVEHRELRACDYGAPTTRKRLFVIARSDGLPIAWPRPTHGKGLLPYRTAAECMQWELTCPSIFERKKPLAENTLKRIARGLKRYVIDAPEPFIIPLTHHGDRRAHPMDEPMPTITGAHRGEHALITPYLAGVGGPEYSGKPTAADRPMGSLMTENHRAIVEPFLVRTAHGEQDASGKKRGRGEHDVGEPLPTVLASNDYALTAAYLARIGQTGGNGKYVNDAREPVGAITTKAEHLVIAAGLIHRGNGEREGQDPRIYDLDKPHPTVMAEGIKTGLVAAFIARHYGGPRQVDGADPQLPLPTITATDHHALVASHLLKLRGDPKDHPNTAQDARAPLPTITASGNHIAEVRAFLIKYYGTDQDPQLSMPLHTVTTKDRFGLVTVQGAEYVIADIGMRMLVPRELFRAQGFPDSYRIEFDVAGKPLTKGAQVRMCGNSVVPPLAAALVRAQFAEREQSEVA